MQLHQDNGHFENFRLMCGSTFILICNSFASDPIKGERMKGELRFLHSLHTAYAGTQYRVIYEINGRMKEIYIHHVGSRENLCKQVSRLGIKPLSKRAA